MADIKFSQFANTPTPNANAFFVGYNGVTGINSRTTLTDLIAAIGAPSGSGTANFVTKWSGTNTLTDSLFYSDANVAKTVFGGVNKGLFIDFANGITSLANNEGFGLIANPWDLYLGDFNDLQNSTTLQILDANRVIKTRDYVGDRGFYLDFENYLFSFGTQQKGFNVNLTNLKYTLGDFGSSNNSTTFQVDDLNQIIKTSSQGSDNGLYINFPSNIYALGYTETGDFVEDNVIGFSAKGYVFQMGEAGGINFRTYFEVDDTNQIIKTSNNYADTGLYLDFTNSVYTLGQQGDNNILKLDSGNNIFQLGNTDNRGLYIDLSNSIYKLGDFNNSISGTNFIVDDIVQIIKTQSLGTDKGLKLDFANNIYYLGDFDGTFNSTSLYVDDVLQRITLDSSRTNFRNLTTTSINALTGNQAGDVVYNSTLNKLCFYNGTSWQQVTSSPM